MARSRKSLASAVVRVGPKSGMAAMCAMVLVAAAGCGTSGTAGVVVAERLVSTANRLPAPLRTALYYHDPRGETWCILSDLTREEILAGDFDTGQFVRIELLWTPRPGSTPMDRDATNVSVRHAVLADGEVGVFEGGGFALPDAEPGASEWSIELRNATLALVTSTEQFRDRLTPARLTGSFTARLEVDEARRVRNAISQRVTDLLNRTWRAELIAPGATAACGRANRVPLPRAAVGAQSAERGTSRFTTPARGFGAP